MRRLAERLCQSDEGRRVVVATIAEAGITNRPCTVSEALSQLVMAGRVVLLPVRDRGAYPLCDPHAQQPCALVSLADVEVEESRGWISIEVLAASGVDVSRLGIELLTADGLTISGSPGAGGQWRSDDLAKGTCDLQLLGTTAYRGSAGRPTAGWDPKKPTTWVVGRSEASLVMTNQHHRILLVDCPTPYPLSV